MSATAPLPIYYVPADPLSYGTLPERRAVWFPLGCAVEIATDSPHIHEAAESVWRDYPAQTPADPVRLHVDVSPDDAPFDQRPPLPRGHESLISIIDSSRNFVVADLARGYARICLSRN